ncbi:MAG: TetR/AcrR family transcriptional regulator [Lachnospiraceae bacterium]|nr:TetR/AcrR family transcriptional regulator [Lachnospiraceae bacterium]
MAKTARPVPGERRPTMRSMRAAKTKELLLKTAYEMFSEYGYDSVTVEDITTRAGVSKGTFYSHFSAKEAVLTDHFRQVDNLYEDTYKELPKDMPVLTKLIHLVDIMCRFCEEKCGVEFLKVIYANQLLHTAADVTVLNMPGRKIEPILEEIAIDGKRRGELPDFMEVDVFAREVSHLAHGILYDWCMLNGGFDLREEAKRVFTQIGQMATAYTQNG